MNTPTLLLSYRYTEDSRRLWQAAVARGWRVERLQGGLIPDVVKVNRRPILYMEALAAVPVAEALGLQLIEPPLDWLPALPERYRQRDIELTTFGDIASGEFPVFVKPPNDKSFPSGVYEKATLPTGIPPETPVLISEVVQWELEYRCFISDRTLRTFCLYSRNGILQEANDFVSTAAEDGDVFRFIHLLLDDPQVPLPSAVVIDVGIIAGRGWAVVEANAAWGSGIYACNASAVLDVVTASVLPLSPQAK